jgi:hypothetical protein
MPPVALALSHDELSMIWRAAAAVDRGQQNAFTQAVMAELEQCPLIGPGSVHRAIAMTQRSFRTPPISTAIHRARR